MGSKAAPDPFKLLLHDISKKLTDLDFESLKYFADNIPCHVIEQIEEAGNRSFALLDKLEEAGIISEDNLCWLNVVFKEMRLEPVLELLHKYETRQSGVSPFKLMLHQVARELNKTQLKELLIFCSSDIGESKCDEIKTSLQLMIEMERHGKIANDNVDFLTKVLDQVENKKLARIVQEYSKEHIVMEENAECQHQSSSQNVMAQKPTRKNGAMSGGPQLNTNEAKEKIEQGSSTEANLPDFELLDIDGSRKESRSVTSSQTSTNLIYKTTVGRTTEDIDEDGDQVKTAEDQCWHANGLKPSTESEEIGQKEKHHHQVRSDELSNDQPVPIDQKQKTHEDSDGTQVEVRNEIMEQYSSISAASTRHTLDDLKQHSIHQTQIICEDNGPWTGVASHRSGMNCTTTEQHLQRLHVDGLDCSLEPETFVSDQDTEGHQTKKDHHDHQQQQQQCLVENKVKSVKSHKSVKLYNYQKELAEPALKGINCIMCAPTGSGKTRTAAYICYELRERACDEGKPFKALFIVCIRNLIEQQKEELMKVFGQEENDSMIVTGINDTAKLSEMLQHFDIIVLTAQILVNCLKSKEVHLDMFQLLILDECHHTNLGHPYNVIMQEYHQMKREKRRVPQIVGLTASLGVGDKEDPVDHYVLMCANLDCTCITHVRNEKNMAELLKHNPRPEVNQIISVEPRDPQEMFILIVADLMCEIESLMTHRTGERSRRGSQKYENWIVDMRTAAESKGLEDDIYICETLQMFNRALMYYDELPAAEVMPLLESHFSEEKRVMKPTKIKEEIYVLYERNIEEMEMTAEEDCLLENQMLGRLCNLLGELYLMNPKAKGVILTEERFVVNGLTSFLQQQDCLKDCMKCFTFMGVGHNGLTMASTEQQDFFERFQKGFNISDQLNVLIATYPVRDDLNGLQCDFAIYYNFVPKGLGSVKSHGAVNVKRSGCYFILKNGTFSEQDVFQKLTQEHDILEFLRKVDDKIF